MTRVDSQLKWFVVCEAEGWAAGRDRRGRVPMTVAHAKTFGTLTTACGLPSGSWEKYWDVAFPPMATPVCPSCLEYVRGDSASKAVLPAATRETTKRRG